MDSFHSMILPALGGGQLALEQFRNQVVLVVNVASQCGLTPQYAGLETLYRQYASRGFSVLGVPCNQFGAQEPGTDEDIRQFCSLNYGVSFPMAGKLEVNGPQRHLLYQWLAGDQAPFPGDITWNFEKFLVGKKGQIIARFSPRVLPDDPGLTQQIESALFE
ncbi:glutathione peroxidase [Azomonas agilis]|uniref:Glutathione peroxidase n=1 Tax=Azomonas agilis TaxID=116849 RepID=A0A562J2M9_9GAMM|nr:glutathione peroxidase [Azomonas agilis]TWH77466.1 glutathione peroxidase [Azomonas agilis]